MTGRLLTARRGVASFDLAVDQAFDHLRGRRAADRVFYAASELGDFGLIWVLLGSGTLSGPEATEAGSLMELTGGGKQPIVLPNGEQRSFLADGDTLVMRGWCEREGAVRIGLGEVSGTVLAAG